LSNWRTKLKVLKCHNYTVILPIIHISFCPESRNRLQGPICKFSKVWGLNCNFPKLRDQIEFSSSSTSNPEFQQKTHCSLQISNTNSPFKQKIITQNHHLLIQSLKINQIILQLLPISLLISLFSLLLFLSPFSLLSHGLLSKYSDLFFFSFYLYLSSLLNYHYTPYSFIPTFKPPRTLLYFPTH